MWTWPAGDFQSPGGVPPRLRTQSPTITARRNNVSNAGIFSIRERFVVGTSLFLDNNGRSECTSDYRRQQEGAKNGVPEQTHLDHRRNNRCECRWNEYGQKNE
jgi:hypothetical protein